MPVVPQAGLVQRDVASRLAAPDQFQRGRPSYTASMFGGMGGGRSGLRAVRLALLVGILIIGATLHHSGSTYHAVYVIYIVIIVGILVASIALRRGRWGQQRRMRGPRDSDPQSMGRGGFGTPPPPPSPPGYHDNPDPESPD